MDLKTARDIARQYNLKAPDGFWKINMPLLVKLIGSGGCGPGKIGDKLIPDTIYCLSIKPACAIHDFCYAFASNEDARYRADKIFLDNMFSLIDKQTKWRFMRALRHRRALKYYEAVRWGGGKHTKK